ncbi:MAG TPA: hypothetical protein VF764_01215, partial [Steroidobacteraceae bacterium]
LLCEVGQVLMQQRIELHAAKIMTVGERAEDVFYLTDFDNRPLAAAAAEQLKERLMQALDQRQAALRAPGAGSGGCANDERARAAQGHHRRRVRASCHTQRQTHTRRAR